MNRVLVTGQAIGFDVGNCASCNFDLDWLVRYPSTLVWSDEILLTPTMWKRIIGEEYVEEKETEFNKSIALIFEMAKEEGLINVIDPKDIINDELGDEIQMVVDSDRNLLCETFVEHAKLGEQDVPGQLFINGSEYCSPYVWSIYASLILSRKLDAQCLLGPHSLNYCKYKFGLEAVKGNQKIQALQSVYEAYLPSVQLISGYALEDRDKCLICASWEKCNSSYLKETENNMRKLLKLRDYDEIHQMKDIVNRIIKKRDNAGCNLNPTEILDEFKREENKIRRRMQKIFPKMNRWVNITTMVSVPIAISGTYYGNNSLTIAGLSTAGLSQIAKQGIDFLTSKYSWIGFSNKYTGLYTNGDNNYHDVIDN